MEDIFLQKTENELLEMKSTLCTMESTLNRNDGRLNIAEEKIIYLKDIIIKNMR